MAMLYPRAARTALLLLLAAARPALAQDAGETGTRDGPRSTVTAPYTTATGRTKPPGAAVGEATPEQRERRTRIERQDDAIENGICIGCDK